MKKIRLLTLLGVTLLSGTLAGCFGGNKETNNDTTSNTGDFIIEDITGENDAVINYNDSLVDLASQCVISENIIWDTYDEETSTTEDILAAINNTITECTNAKENINKLGDWEDDASLKNGAISIIEKEIEYYSKFRELLPYLEKEELTEDEKGVYDSIFAEVQALDEELAQANEDLIAIQEKFAEDHGFSLENEESEVDGIEE